MRRITEQDEASHRWGADGVTVKRSFPVTTFRGINSIPLRRVARDWLGAGLAMSILVPRAGSPLGEGVSRTFQMAFTHP